MWGLVGDTLVSVTVASRFGLCIDRSEGVTPGSHSLHAVGKVLEGSSSSGPL